MASSRPVGVEGAGGAILHSVRFSFKQPGYSSYAAAAAARLLFCALFFVYLDFAPRLRVTCRPVRVEGAGGATLQHYHEVNLTEYRGVLQLVLFFVP